MSDQPTVFHGWSVKSLKIAIGVTTACLSVLFLIYGSIEIYEITSLQKNGIETVAVYAGFSAPRFQAYRFRDAFGNMQTVNLMSFEEPGVAGSDIQILYDPSNPQRAIVDSIWTWIVGIVSLSFGIFMGVAVVVRRRVFFGDLET